MWNLSQKPYRLYDKNLNDIKNWAKTTENWKLMTQDTFCQPKRVLLQKHKKIIDLQIIFYLTIREAGDLKNKQVPKVLSLIRCCYYIILIGLYKPQK